ncbi:hypothetical protein [Burkholderia multivorans]|uniref:hypothetical protein n=1 Tax=Burkholderia multivorans TaxID=87883 RepID=UPI00057F4EB4|nr:hypothetical protein [Burkholderia multivorans]KHS09436.1 hypothetical protein BMD20_29665 [Burkholderia multivorans]KHS10367.1 hypothetical protein BMD22_28160 [Burkholderia multivorans]MDR9230064.1 hypothetical protein [Burkholderia multivorans]HDR9474431.1 hypothetical protein [Burkholderia multivorans]HDR9480273.1 hypothetical protein [Burkholderia multivorans]
MSDAETTSGPQTRRDAALRIVLGEMHDLFARAEALAGRVQEIDASTKETARSVHDATMAAKKLLAAMPDKPVPMVEPKKANQLAVAIAAALIAGIVAGVVVVGGMQLFSKGQEEAKLGRAVTAAFPMLDADTQAKLQAAINKASR